jgi:hypothetical protein
MFDILQYIQPSLTYLTYPIGDIDSAMNLELFVEAAQLSNASLNYAVILNARLGLKNG